MSIRNTKFKRNCFRCQNSYEESGVLRDPENPSTSESYRENKGIETFVSISSCPAFANF